MEDMLGWKDNMLEARFRKNVRPQCNATFMATALSSSIVENMSSFEKKEVWNALLTLIFFYQFVTLSGLFF